MKRLAPIALASLLVARLSAIGGAAETNAGTPGVVPVNPPSPTIQFDSSVYNFGNVFAGQPVTHTFLFTNTGTSTLEITGVYPGCHCTTPGDWTRKVEPGQTGVIPLRLETTLFSGPIGRPVTVVCNDKQHPALTLQLIGTVSRPIDVTPATAVINIPPDDITNSLAVPVRIVSNLEQPIDLSAPECSNPAFTTDLKTIQPGKEYQLTIQPALPLPKSTAQGNITIKTSSTNVPIINVVALAIVQPAFVMMPSMVLLPSNRLTNLFTSVIAVENRSRAPVQLLEPSVNATNIDLQVVEIQPGRRFQLVVNFRAGLELAQNQVLEVTVKTSNPKFPLLKVPVRQPFRPPISAAAFKAGG